MGLCFRHFSYWGLMRRSCDCEFLVKVDKGAEVRATERHG